jgi:hypothetical protein
VEVTMNVERVRTIWKKALPYALAAFAVGTVGTATVKHFAAESCCKPGASCCYPGSPCCHGKTGNGHVASR